MYFCFHFLLDVLSMLQKPLNDALDDDEKPLNDAFWMMLKNHWMIVVVGLSSVEILRENFTQNK